MARRKDQAVRRTQVEEAAERALARKGVEAVRVTDVAAEAGLSAGAVLYYYPTRSELIRVALLRVLERFVDRRRALVDEIADPVDALVAMVREGFPSDADDAEVVTLYAGVQAVRDDPDLAAIIRDLTARQVALYREILERGRNSGAFRLAGDVQDLATNLVALEDAYGLYAVGPGFPVAEGLRLTLAFAEVAVGRELPGDRLWSARDASREPARPSKL